MSDQLDRNRIDILWRVRIRAVISTPLGPATALATVTLVLGTYAGIITRDILAENINSRGLHEGDVDEVYCPGGAISVVEAEEILAKRKILPGEIISASIEAVILDDKEIATCLDFEQDNEDET